MIASQALLGLLCRDASYGYDLKRVYDTLFGTHKPLAYGQVYATLRRLKRDGKVLAAGSSETSDGPERIKYRATTDGEESLHAWLAAPEEPVPALQSTLYVKTVLSLLLDTQARQYLDAQHAAHIQRMRELTRERRETHDISHRLLTDYAIFHLEADLRWIELTTARLQALKEEITHGAK